MSDETVARSGDSPGFSRGEYVNGTVALTVSTNEIKSWGIVGIVIIVIAAGLVIRLAKSLVGRAVWTCLALVLLLLLWQQHTAIEQSVKACDPHVLFLHLQISDPAQQAKCQSVLNPN